MYRTGSLSNLRCPNVLIPTLSLSIDGLIGGLPVELPTTLYYYVVLGDVD